MNPRFAAILLFLLTFASCATVDFDYPRDASAAIDALGTRLRLIEAAEKTIDGAEVVETSGPLASWVRRFNARFLKIGSERQL